MNKTEKDKVRQLTFRFIERHCNIDKVCQVCGANNAQIHHVDYENIYTINLLCLDCHWKVHNKKIVNPEIIDLQSDKYYDPNKKVDINNINSDYKRDYVKESEWEKKTYKRLLYKCPLELWVQLEKQLKHDNLTYVEWYRQIVKNYLERNEDK